MRIIDSGIRLSAGVINIRLGCKGVDEPTNGVGGREVSVCTREVGAMETVGGVGGITVEDKGGGMKCEGVGGGTIATSFLKGKESSSNTISLVMTSFPLGRRALYPLKEGLYPRKVAAVDLN